jgi:hypothetical protein
VVHRFTLARVEVGHDGIVSVRIEEAEDYAVAGYLSIGSDYKEGYDDSSPNERKYNLCVDLSMEREGI